MNIPASQKTIDQNGNEVVEAQEVSPPQPRRHTWGPSHLGHGDAQCTHCLMTNREAWVLGPFCIR